MLDNLADPASGRPITITIAQAESEGQACEQDGNSGAENAVAAGPIACSEIAGAEQIVGDAAGADADGQKQPLVQKDRTINPERHAEKGEDHDRPSSRHPDIGELEIEQRYEAAGSEAGEQCVEVQALVVLRILFVWLQLRVDKKENECDGENGIDTVAYLSAIVRCEIGEEDPSECGGERHVGLETELPNLAHESIFEKNQSEHGPGNRDA